MKQTDREIAIYKDSVVRAFQSRNLDLERHNAVLRLEVTKLNRALGKKTRHIKRIKGFLEEANATLRQDPGLSLRKSPDRPHDPREALTPNRTDPRIGQNHDETLEETRKRMAQ